MQDLKEVVNQTSKMEIDHNMTTQIMREDQDLDLLKKELQYQSKGYTDQVLMAQCLDNISDTFKNKYNVRM